jgi:hypothetical protein
MRTRGAVGTVSGKGGIPGKDSMGEERSAVAIGGMLNYISSKEKCGIRKGIENR